jgi:hypothetical protein
MEKEGVGFDEGGVTAETRQLRGGELMRAREASGRRKRRDR